MRPRAPASRPAAAPHLAAALLLVAGTAPAAGPEGADGLDPAARRGREIYLHGRGAGDEPITALMGDARIEVPATALPCASCHGRDGRGRPEGGVVPSDVTWSALSRPATARGPGGRSRQPYTERLVVRAVTLGVDSSGNRLDPVMPSYRMSRADADDLVAFLRRLGEVRDPGVEPDALRLGVLLPPDEPGSHAATAAALRRVAAAHAAAVERRGGIYGRRLEPRFLALPAAPAERRGAVARFLDEEAVFALVASFTAGADAELAALAAEREVPLVGPLTLHAGGSPTWNRQVFHLYAGVADQARALVRRAAAGGRTGAPGGAGPGPAVILHADDPLLAAAARAAAAEAAAAGWAEVPIRAFSPGRLDAAAEAGRLRDAEVEHLVLLAGGGDAKALAEAVAAAGWRGTLHAPGPLAGAALLDGGAAAAGRVVLAFPTLPRDRRPETLGVLREALAAGPTAGGGDGVAVGATEVAAWAALELLAAGLERVGRDASRERLIEALEELRNHPTGLTPPVTFGPNRRVGSRGAWVVEMQPEGSDGTPRAAWVAVDQEGPPPRADGQAGTERRRGAHGRRPTAGDGEDRRAPRAEAPGRARPAATSRRGP